MGAIGGAIGMRRFLLMLILVLAPPVAAVAPARAAGDSAAAVGSPGSCAPGKAYLRGSWGQAAFDVEIAADSDSRARGLLFRRSLDDFAGMLFIFERPQRAQFWMKNTLIPLDMLFLDKRGVVRRIKENATPQSLALIDGGDGVLAVLEVRGGTVARLGLTPGTEMRNPAFGADAAWPCR